GRTDVDAQRLGHGGRCADQCAVEHLHRGAPPHVDDVFQQPRQMVLLRLAGGRHAIGPGLAAHWPGHQARPARHQTIGHQHFHRLADRDAGHLELIGKRMLARHAILVETPFQQLFALDEGDLAILRQWQRGSQAGNSKDVLIYRQWDKYPPELSHRDDIDPDYTTAYIV